MPTIKDEQGNDVVPWSVPVENKNNLKKTNSNQRWAAARRARTNVGFICVLEEEGPMAICTADVEWVKLELTLDSGAAETICPGAEATNVPTAPGRTMDQSVRFTCAGEKDRRISERSDA